jgi:F-type H+-transporting ATPase subunit gamma
MASSREIRRKIKSIRSTRQITRAMELVSAAKMKKAVSAATSMRTYASTALMLLTQLADRAENFSHPLLEKRDVKKVLVVVFSSDRGLCGGFNTMLFKKLVEHEKMLKAEGVTVHYVTVGKRGQEFLARMGRNILASFPAMSSGAKTSQVLPIGKMVMDLYTDSTYDKVYLLYQHFFSALSQKPTAYQLLPFSKKSVMEMGTALKLFDHMKGGAQSMNDATDYLYEPSPGAILGNLLPQLTQMQVFQAVQESAASEHSARMLAMRNATDNASEFIDDLTLYLNQVRQAAITAEIAEISAGKIALGF